MVDPSQRPGPASNLKDIFSDEVEEIFCAAVEMPDAAKRRAFIEQACGGNASLRSKVEALMASQADVERFFHDSHPGPPANDWSVDRPAGDGPAEILVSATSDAPAGEKLGAWIGRYQLLQVIGEGGYGTVCLAEQDLPVRRRVALKIVKLGMDTKSVIARFEAERQALAMMDHPNIAHVFDAGMTVTGRPYFVMELVRGTKITTYCDQHQLDLNQRLQLFFQVCHAVQHAHQKGIIHRDIKPSNILVTLHDGQPIPMVIDFGIAKAMQGRLTDQTIFTPYEQFIGTPAYMSPEQAEASRADVDTRSDIYSLGVLLYELLTGHTPFNSTQLIESGLDEMRRTLREREPALPSAGVGRLPPEELARAANCRGVAPAKLIALLKRDLDSIVMKALDKDPDRRYETANGLAMDLHRYLNHEPVLALPARRLYRLRKLVRRNKVVFFSSTAVVLALAIGLGVALMLLFRARAAERQEARLRGIAERGLTTEAELRNQAETRETIIKAALLINQGSNAAADSLVAQLPLTQSTMEGSEVFQTLGEWDALNGRWQEAKARFRQLQHVSRINLPQNASLDWTKAAIAMIESNDREAYARFCAESITSFNGVDDPLVAGRVLRNCLLVPASPHLIDALKPLAKCAGETLQNIDFSAKVAGWKTPWRCEVLALWEYRAGNPSAAMVWCNRCLNAVEKVPARDAATEAVLAMCQAKLGKTEDARNELARARSLIQHKFQTPLTLNSTDGAWYDWVFARMLMNEATELIQPELNEAPQQDSGLDE